VIALARVSPVSHPSNNVVMVAECGAGVGMWETRAKLSGSRENFGCSEDARLWARDSFPATRSLSWMDRDAFAWQRETRLWQRRHELPVEKDVGQPRGTAKHTRCCWRMGIQVCIIPIIAIQDNHLPSRQERARGPSRAPFCAALPFPPSDE
jgi:hypothetical protein